MAKVTRDAVEALATERGVSLLAMLTELQTAAAKLGDEEALDVLCAIKSAELGITDA